MKRIVLFIIAVLAASSASFAQDPKQEIKANPCLAGSNYLAYPGPEQQVLTPAPIGYKPFYISHYGRHGSRYLINPNDYLFPLNTLAKADSLGKLTEMGKEVLRKVRLLKAESNNRLGELTLLGAQQHAGIARRMVERFPDVFADSASVDAKSTVVIRCIISMESELQEMLRLNRCLKISHDASEHDMYYMNLSDPEIDKARYPNGLRKKLEAWEDKNYDPKPLMKRLFTDLDYASKLNERKLAGKLFTLANIIQNSEIRHKISLYDIFTADELYNLWNNDNTSWYVAYAHCPLNGATQPYRERNLLRNIIHEADSCIAIPTHGATLRFGHETMVMPFVCLLGLDGYDRQITSFDDVAKSGWVNYRIFMMASNIQFIFYRRSATDRNPLVKVLLNENEATLPVKSDTKPYYRWSDVKAYYQDKLAKAGY